MTITLAESDGQNAKTMPAKNLRDDPPVAATEDGGPALKIEVTEPPHRFNYEVVQGYFLQNGPKPKSVEFEDLLDKSFGMLDTSSERWHNLRSSIEKLQKDAPEGVIYKVLFVGRHGEGMHNHAVTQIGIDAWEEYWAFQTTNGTLTWGPDPPLSELGESQAKAINKCWKEQAPLGAPIKKGEMRWFCSPFTRAGQTLLLSWDGLLADKVEVWEDFREIYGSHTCDQRSSKTIFQKRFPTFEIEDGFVEEDELWKPDDRETDAHMQMRCRRALDRLFGKEGAKETYLSLTGHSAIFRNLLAVLGHQPYPLSTGEMIPVVVKATRIPPQQLQENGSA